MIESLYLESCFFVWHVRKKYKVKNTKNTDKNKAICVYTWTYIFTNIRTYTKPRVVNKTSRCFYNADLVPSGIHGTKSVDQGPKTKKSRTKRVQDHSGRWIPDWNDWIFIAYLLTYRHLVVTKNRENNHQQDRALGPLAYQHQKA